MDNYFTTNNCAPKYMYDQPMFMVTVSVVIIDDNGVILVTDSDLRYTGAQYRFPGGMVKAGQETIQFAALRHVKEQTGILIKKDTLIPVDFRSEPERSKSGNVIDIGFVVVLEKKAQITSAKWVEVDFEVKKPILHNRDYLSMDNNILLERAIDIVTMMK